MPEIECSFKNLRHERLHLVKTDSKSIPGVTKPSVCVGVLIRNTLVFTFIFNECLRSLRDTLSSLH